MLLKAYNWDNKQNVLEDRLPVTIHDLAKKLNLSITTVSRALDGYSDVSEDTRKRVEAAAREIGYEPSFAARQLRRKRADAIGYILPTSSPRFTDPFYVSFLTGLCDEIAAWNLDLIITSCPPDSEKEKHQYKQWVQSSRVDGIVINRTRLDDWRVDFLEQNNVKFVSLGKGDGKKNYPHIVVQDTSGMEKLVAHLVEKGHRSIAFIGASPDLVVHADRYKGYLNGLEHAQINPMPALICNGDLTEETGYQITHELLKLPEPPTAIIGCNDLTALGALRAAREKGLYIGTELAIAGYDGIPETEFTDPPLTTLYQPTYEIARMLAKMLVSTIEGKKLENPIITLEPQLIIRPSTG